MHIYDIRSPIRQDHMEMMRPSYFDIELNQEEHVSFTILESLSSIGRL